MCRSALRTPCVFPRLCCGDRSDPPSICYLRSRQCACFFLPGAARVDVGCHPPGITCVCSHPARSPRPPSFPIPFPFYPSSPPPSASLRPLPSHSSHASPSSVLPPSSPSVVGRVCVCVCVCVCVFVSTVLAIFCLCSLREAVRRGGIHAANWQAATPRVMPGSMALLA